MLEEEKWCKETLKKHFNKTLEITSAEEKNFKRAVSGADSCHFAALNINHAMSELETIVISLVNTEVLRIRNAI